MKNFPLDAIEQLLHEAMEHAVSNGANSISMPDYLVEIAVFLDAYRAGRLDFTCQ